MGGAALGMRSSPWAVVQRRRRQNCPHPALKIRGFVCTPEKIEQAFSAFDCVEVDKDFSRAGGIYCYKDGERTELQLCS